MCRAPCIACPSIAKEAGYEVRAERQNIYLNPNGDYLALRANCLEDNLVLWKFENGKRSQVKWVNDAPAATRQWHDLKLRIIGAKVEAYLDGKLYLEHTLPEPVSGRIGLWSKADSHIYFDDFTVAQIN